MFGSGKNKKEDTSRSNRTVASYQGAVTLIGQGTIIEGDITIASDIRIDGTVNGNIKGDNKVIIGSQGVLNGDVSCKVIDLQGQMRGNIFCSEEVRLNNTAQLIGDIKAPQFSIDLGAKFVGRSLGQETKALQVPISAKDKNAISEKDTKK